jgi:hypothetical protein
MTSENQTPITSIVNKFLQANGYILGKGDARKVAEKASELSGTPIDCTIAPDDKAILKAARELGIPLNHENEIFRFADNTQIDMTDPMIKDALDWVVAKAVKSLADPKWPILLNDLAGFQWASSPRGDGFAKVCLCGESFWLRECTRQDDTDLWSGIVDNELVDTQEHGLDLDDVVCFRATTQ